ncbi:hypothetical protein Tco_1335850 [Tanacetum coccineum]
MKAIFNQMETEVDKCSIDKKYFEIEKKELSLDNDYLLEHIICQDVMNVVMHANDHHDNVLPANNNSLVHDNDRLMKLFISQDLVHTAVNSLAAINDYKSMEQSFVDEYEENFKLQTELDKKNDMIEKAVYNELLKRCSRLENRCISHEIKLQRNKESFQSNRPSHYQDAPEFKDFFIINELQAQLEAKNVSIAKLKEHIANLKGKNIVESVQKELLIYVSATCPSTKHISDKLVAATPMNRTSKVRFAELCETSNDNTHKQVKPQEKQATNNSMLPSTGVSCSTKASGSKPRINTKNDRTPQTLCSNKKNNKVEDHPRIAKSSLNNLNGISKPVCNLNVQ